MSLTIRFLLLCNIFIFTGCDLDCSIKTCCCAGFGCFRQRISGAKDSVLFVASGGTPIFKHLKEGETITVDSRSVTMIEDSVTLGITPNGRIGMCCFGGEGCFSTTLTGPGKIFMQVSTEVYCTVGDVRCDTDTASCGPCTHAHTVFRNKLLLSFSSTSSTTEYAVYKVPGGGASDFSGH
jgi:hypothetical protein